MCVINDTESNFFWFGSTVYEDDYKDYCANRRRQLLDEALRESGTGVTLPVVPPLQQRSIGQFIRNEVVHGILKDMKIDDKTEEWDIGKSYTRLLNTITKRRVLEPGDVEQWQVMEKTDADMKMDLFNKALKEIVEKICSKRCEELTQKLTFDIIKEHLDEVLKVGRGQRYGHCAETYPLIFILRLVSFALLVESDCADPGVPQQG